MTRWRVAATALLIALPLVAAGAAQAPKGRVHTVTIEAMTFTPQTLTVRPGDVVVWVNQDFFPHTATASDGSFDSREIAQGASWRYEVKARGEFPYVCTLHPTMKATLVVE